LQGRNAVIEELKVQGKWQEENKTENETNNTGTAGEQPADPDSPSNTENAPFIGIMVLAAVIGAVVCAGKAK
jgi:hypothetical protein